MIELKPWALSLSVFFIVMAFLFAGFGLAAPVDSWKFMTGIIGLFSSIFVLVVVAVFGRKS